MILIISENTDNFSLATENWLNKYGVKYFRINSEGPIEFLTWVLTNTSCEILLANKIGSDILILSKTTVWHRRGRINFALNFNPMVLAKEYVEFLNNESAHLFNAMMLVLKEENHLIGTHVSQKDNRLYNQYLAIKYGFKTPASIITSSKKRLIEFKSKYKDLVVKPISNVFMRTVGTDHLRGEIKVFNQQYTDELPNDFFPMLFQEKIDRDFEVRVFCFNNGLYAMAVIPNRTQNDIVDVREINQKSIRQVPIGIPSEIKNKIIKILNALQLDTASFDFIVDTKGDFYFLELNPYGMLNNMDIDCNFPIAKNVAKFLIQYDTREN